MPEDFWDEDSILIDLLFESNLSLAEIAKELNWTQAQTSQKIKKLGLGWVRRTDRKMSRGQAALTHMIQKILPSEKIINEYHIGDQLRLDIYCPSYHLGAEYHGRQHFFFSNLFYKDEYDFKRALERDEKKVDMCQEQGIALVVFRYNDQLTEDAVYDRILDAVRNAPTRYNMDNVKSGKKYSFKDNPFYESMQQRRREYQRDLYRKMKSQRKPNGK